MLQLLDRSRKSLEEPPRPKIRLWSIGERLRSALLFNPGYQLTRSAGEEAAEEFPSSPRALEAEASRALAHRVRRDPDEGLPPLIFSHLSDAWAASASFERLASRTKSDYLAAKAKIDARWGALSLSELDDFRIRPHLLNWRDEMGTGSARQADAVFAVLRQILEWGRDRGFVGTNHAVRPKKLYRADRSDMIWHPEHLEAFRAVASPPMSLALELAIWTGQRQGDLLRLRWSSYDGNRLALRQGKRGRKIDMPVASPLKKLLDSAPRTAPTILTAPNGHPWRTDPRPIYFMHLWRKTTLAAGLDGLHFHDLRGTTCTILAEAGATPSEIAAMLGWTLSSINQMLDRYQAMTASLSNSAVAKLEQLSCGMAEKFEFAQNL